MKRSDCCGAKILGEDFCGDCREHCDVEDDEETYEAVANHTHESLGWVPMACCHPLPWRGRAKRRRE